MRLLYSWNDFFFALILTRTEALTAPVAVVNFMNHEGWEWGKIAAGRTMVMLPVLFSSILVRKFLVHGLTAARSRAEAKALGRTPSGSAPSYSAHGTIATGELVDAERVAEPAIAHVAAVLAAPPVLDLRLRARHPEAVPAD